MLVSWSSNIATADTVALLYVLMGSLPSTLGQQVNIRQMGMAWPDIHWLVRDKGGLVAAMFETWT
jgi:hypothetical protein